MGTSKKLLPMLLLALSGCKLDLRDGALLCNPNGKQCPDGYHCAGNDRCYLNGHEPDLSAMEDSDLAVVPDLSGSDSFSMSELDLLENPDLTPIKHQGDPCVVGVDTCDTGHCVDGYCCNSDCADACGACDVSNSLGACTAVSGPPHGTRSCNGTGTCAGTCNGSSTSCTYPTSQVICGAACDGHCDGAGMCSAGTGGSCSNGFACGSSACLTSCSLPEHCQTNFTCQAPNCVRVPESDCLDGVDNNGDGKVDCADPTCTTVECVPAVPVGDEVGVFTSASCPTDYGPAVVFHQTVIIPDCSGCGCQPSMQCQSTISVSTTDSNCSSPTSWGTVTVTEVGSGGSFGAPTSGCASGALATVKSVLRSAPVKVGSTTAAPTGSASTPPASWDPASQMKFCPARLSPSGQACSATQVCVRKRASGPVCARIPNAQQACPGGYTNPDTWYQGFTDGRFCGSCGSCSVTNQGDCNEVLDDSVWALLSANACTTSPSDTTLSNSASGNTATNCKQAVTNRQNRSLYVAHLGARNAVCTCSAPLMGSVTRTSGSTICCQ